VGFEWVLSGYSGCKAILPGFHAFTEQGVGVGSKVLRVGGFPWVLMRSCGSLVSVLGLVVGLDVGSMEWFLVVQGDWVC